MTNKVIDINESTIKRYVESLRPDYFAFISPKKDQLDCIEYLEKPKEEELLTLNEKNVITEH
jgi:uridine kinase